MPIDTSSNERGTLTENSLERAREIIQGIERAPRMDDRLNIDTAPNDGTIFIPYQNITYGSGLVGSIGEYFDDTVVINENNDVPRLSDSPNFTIEHPSSNLNKEQRDALNRQKIDYLDNISYQDIIKIHKFVDEDICFSDTEIRGDLRTNIIYDDGVVVYLKYKKTKNNDWIDALNFNVTFEEFKDLIVLGYCVDDGFKFNNRFETDDGKKGVSLCYNSSGIINPSIDRLVKSKDGYNFTKRTQLLQIITGNSTAQSLKVYYKNENVKFDFINIWCSIGYDSDVIVKNFEIGNDNEEMFENIRESFALGCAVMREEILESQQYVRVNMRQPNVNSKSHRSIRKGTYMSHNVPFSCEIECYGDRKKVAYVSNNMHADLGMSNDGSLTSDIGVPVEIQTPILQGKRGEICVAELCDLLVKNDFKVDKTCGLHIHLDGTVFQLRNKSIVSCEKRPTMAINLYLAYRLFEPVILSFLPSTRRNNHYCADFNMVSEHRDNTVCFLPIENSIEIMDNIKNIREFEMYWYKTNSYITVNHLKSQRYTPTRYYGVNFHSLLKDNHLEIRYHSGTLNYEKILYWTDLHGKIVSKCADGTITSEMIKEIMSSKQSLEELTKTLFSILDLNTDTVEYLLDRQGKFKNVKSSDEILIDKTKKMGVV